MSYKDSVYHKLYLAIAFLNQFFNNVATNRITIRPIYFTSTLLQMNVLNITIVICEKATIINVSLPMFVNIRVRNCDFFSTNIEIIKIKSVPEIAPKVIGIIGKILLKHISRCQKRDMVSVSTNKRHIFHILGFN